jgi:hypothetical protein
MQALRFARRNGLAALQDLHTQELREKHEREKELQTKTLEGDFGQFSSGLVDHYEDGGAVFGGEWT